MKRPTSREKPPSKAVNIGGAQDEGVEVFTTFKLRHALAERQQLTFQSTGLLGGNSAFHGNLADSLGDPLFNWKNSEVAFYLSIPGSDIPTEKFHSSMQSGARIQSYSRVVTATCKMCGLPVIVLNDTASRTYRRSSEGIDRSSRTG